MTREDFNARYPWMKDTELFNHANGGGWVEHPERVDKTAFIGGDAQVYGNARVSGDAQVYGIPWIISLGHHTIVKCDGDVICIGCHANTLTAWLDNYEAIGRAEGYTADEIARYGAALRFIAELTKTQK